jgi:oxaloacetate decarboxylase alpha subunit
MTEVKILDTTLRDGHQCLWATRMSTPMMLPAAERLDRIGFQALEVMGAVQFDTCVRYLKEDPWARLRALKKRITRTPLQALIRSKCALAFELQPDDIANMWVERLVANGIDRFIAFDGLHDLDNLVPSLLYAKKLGAYTTGWLIFSDSPIHSDALYVRKAREFLERARVDALMIEDTSGILTPERASTLVPAIKKEIGDVPLGLHVHNLVGLAQRTQIEAVKRGVDHLYTCISPIADGNAPPSIQTTARNLRYLGFEVDVDDRLIDEVSRHFEAIALAEGKPLGKTQDFDAANFGHQVPGGVLSNLIAQLEAAGLGHKIDEVLSECTRVREELGWPIQVTPFSQFIGVQATINVIKGERYKGVPNEVKKYALGYYGKLLAPVEPDVLDRIVENGAKSIALQPGKPQDALPALRKQYLGADEDELLLRHSFPGTLVADMYAAPPDKSDYSLTEKPFLHLIKEIASQSNLGHVSIQKGSMKIDLRRRRGSSGNHERDGKSL